MSLQIDQEFAAAAKQRKKTAAAAAGYLLLSACLKGGTASDGFFWGSLALAAYSDQLTKEVRDFCYLPAVISSFAGAVQAGAAENIPDAVLFAFLQWLLFRRFYGESDCLAFSVCALYMAGNQRGFLDYLVLMAAAFLLLAAVQGARRNINKKGNLKQPVALIPYIAAAMLII